MSRTLPAPDGLSSSQTILLALLVGFSLGTVGLLALALMVWLSHQRFGVDRSSKHGISVRNTSRLGGLAIALFLMIVSLISLLDQEMGLNLALVVPITSLPLYIWPALLIGIIGLADDVGVAIKPSMRLSMMMVVGLVFFLVRPELLPNRLLEILSVEGDWGVFVLGVASTVLLAGFVNAANISDGANGLLAGLCLVFFLVAWRLQGDGWSFYLLVILLCFWLINVLTGRIMLGDLGAYALGALIVLVGFNLFDEQGVSPFFLSSLLCYPCIELLRVMVVRKLKGKSPLTADDTHFHNLLNSKLRNSVRGNTLPNSLTGLIVVLITSLPGVLMFNLGLQGDTLVNLAVFCSQVVVFLFLWAWLERNDNSSMVAPREN